MKRCYCYMTVSRVTDESQCSCLLCVGGSWSFAPSATQLLPLVSFALYCICPVLLFNRLLFVSASLSVLHLSITYLKTVWVYLGRPSCSPHTAVKEHNRLFKLLNRFYTVIFSLLYWTYKSLVVDNFLFFFLLFNLNKEKKRTKITEIAQVMMN